MKTRVSVREQGIVALGFNLTRQTKAADLLSPPPATQ
jgi:hypothetical protein